MSWLVFYGILSLSHLGYAVLGGRCFGVLEMEVFLFSKRRIVEDGSALLVVVYLERKEQLEF